MSDDERTALAAADSIIAEHGIVRYDRDSVRLLLGIAYLQGSRDGLTDTAALADAAFARLADDLAAAVKP